MSEPKEFTLSIDAGPGADAEVLERLALQLSEELRELDDVESINPVHVGEAPEERTKMGGELVALGSMIVSMAISKGVLTTLVGKGSQLFPSLHSFLRLIYYIINTHVKNVDWGKVGSPCRS